MPKHLRHAGINSWLEYTNSHTTNKTMAPLQQFVFPFPKRMRKDEWVKNEMNERMRVVKE
jgi:hypothetical protein